MRHLWLGLLPLAAYASTADIQVHRYIVTFPQHQRVSYQGAFIQRFPQGFPVGVGSGVTFTGKTQEALTFETVTDRGPNADSDPVDGQDAKIFASPDFTPMIMTLRINENDAQAINPRLLRQNGVPVSGLPLPQNQVGSTGEIPLNDRGERLRYDKRGLDSEAITSDGAEGFWLADEYGPFLVHIDEKGHILQRKGPQPVNGQHTDAGGLPAILQWRQPNRGFEGLARLPNGQLIAAVQSTLDIHGETRNRAQFIRLLRYDPATGATKMYAYPIDARQYKKTSDAKIGDVAAIDDTHLLLIEQGKDPFGKMHNRVIQVDLTDATDLSPSDAAPAEYDSLPALEQKGIRMVKKQQILDLPDLGWQQEKAEGLTLVDKKTLAVMNDNDFGLAAGMKPLPASQAISELWLLHLPDPLPWR